MDQISDKILHYGHYKETLDKVVDIMRSEYPSSIILRGNMGSGKKTLIAEALEITKVKYARISPEQFNDDFTAMRAIATELEYKVHGTTISDFMSKLKDKASGRSKIVIILEDFEDLCSKRQSLLYNLMNLIHTNPTKHDKGPNLTLIGITTNLEWAENVEKRVRSRLNAKCINLKLPYGNKEEYTEFASLLLGGYKISPKFREQLEWMYWFTNRSIRTLKKYLSTICDVDKKGKLIVRFDPERYKSDYCIVKNNILKETLLHLTKDQLDLVKLAVLSCYRKKETTFTLKELDAIQRTEDGPLIDLQQEQVQRDLAILVRLRIFKPGKQEELIGTDTVLYPSVTPNQFKAVIQGHEGLKNCKTDIWWKQLK